MKAFSITCTTCQKRLRVRNAAAIGQILICPHCSSMVLVQPDDSAGEPPPAAESAASPPPVAPEEPPPASPPIASPPPASPPIAEPGSSPPKSPQYSPRSEDPETADPDLPETEPLLPDQSWVSPAVQQRQQWLLLGFAALVGASLAVGLLGVLALRMSQTDPQPRPQAAAPDTHPEPDDHDSAPPPPSDSEPDANGEGQEGRDSGEGKEDQEEAEAAKEPDGLVSVGEGADDPPADPEPREAPSPEPEPGPETDEPTDVAPPPEESSDQEPEEPGSGDPGESPPPEVPRDVDSPEPESDEARSLAETLDVFGAFMEDSPFEPAHKTPGAEEPEIPARPPRAGGAIQVPQPEPRTIDVADRLDDAIPRIELAEVPLATFARFMSRMSTIPISLDPDALALMNLDARTPVQVQMADGRVQDILETALRPLRLAPVQVGDHLLITRPIPADDPLRHHRHSVQDLVGDDEQQLAELADWIVRFVVPDSWESAGGTGRIETTLPDLEIHQQDTVLFRVLLFCERLRVARELPRTTQLAPELSRREPRVNRARSQLAQPLQRQSIQPERMMEVVEEITAQTDLQILVDWRALGELGWTPEAEITFHAEGQPLGEVLPDRLQPLGLTYRVVDDAMIQITTPEAVYRHWDVEFYRWDPQAGETEDDGDRLAALQDALGEQGLHATEFGLQVDPISQHLIAALPQPYHRWLQEWLASSPEESP